jgi:hypothetical protein
MAAVLLVVVGAGRNKIQKNRRSVSSTFRDTDAGDTDAPATLHGGDVAVGVRPPLHPNPRRRFSAWVPARQANSKKLLVSSETDYTGARLKTEPIAAARKVAI